MRLECTSLPCRVRKAYNIVIYGDLGNRCEYIGRHQPYCQCFVSLVSSDWQHDVCSCAMCIHSTQRCHNRTQRYLSVGIDRVCSSRACIQSTLAFLSPCMTLVPRNRFRPWTAEFKIHFSELRRSYTPTSHLNGPWHSS
jgi:hypothetical protein